MSSLFWRACAVLAIIGLFYVGNGLRSFKFALPTLATPALANVSVASDNVETVITTSSDGRTIYIWRYFGAQPPKYLGMAEALPQR